MIRQRWVEETREAVLQAGIAVWSPALDPLPNFFALDSHDLKDCSLEKPCLTSTDSSGHFQGETARGHSCPAGPGAGDEARGPVTTPGCPAVSVCLSSGVLRLLGLQPVGLPSDSHRRSRRPRMAGGCWELRCPCYGVTSVKDKDGVCSLAYPGSGLVLTGLGVGWGAASLQDLHKKYSYIRKTRPDGNCFYRAFGFSHLEALLDDSKELQR